MVLDLDQYADGKAARLWSLYIGDQNERTRHYKHFLKQILSDHQCSSVLDVACGTGVDSVMLLDEGYDVTSCDFSDKMLKVAWQTRWRRRKEAAFDNWEIYEANWLTLPKDLAEAGRRQYDAVICLGNSFAHLPDLTGGQKSHKCALSNFANMVRPGGVLLIDHRNYDHILDHGRAPSRNIYYNSRHVRDIRTSVVYQNGNPTQIVLDYFMDSPSIETPIDKADHQESQSSAGLKSSSDNEFTLTYYPHRVDNFKKLLKESFNGNVDITTYGDFQPVDQTTEPPAFFIHVCRKGAAGKSRVNSAGSCDTSTCSGGWSSGDELY